MSRILIFMTFLTGIYFSTGAQSVKGGVPVNKNQASANGKIYALVIGVSAYQSFKSLQFADKDAGVFYSYLRSRAGGEIDSANIFFRVNEKATAGQFAYGIDWLLNRADSVGETAFIYFSGHGDARNADEVYLLCHDAPNHGNANMYMGSSGVIPLYSLKKVMNEMVKKGVKVIFITDACRTRDLPGQENGNFLTTNGITETRAGEIQMTSCSANQESLESQKWGNGRGVFSYYLINGLSGLADNSPENGVVTFSELKKYVEENVQQETRPVDSEEPKQTPYFCCNEKSQTVLARVDSMTRQLVRKSIQDKSTELRFVYAGSKGGTDRYKDTALNTLYNRFVRAIEFKQFLGNREQTASYFLDELLKKVSDKRERSDLKSQLVAGLIDEAQERINFYAKPPVEDTLDKLNYEYFNTGALLLAEAIKFVEANTMLRKEVRARQLFFEARALVETGISSDVDLGLRKIDSSLKLNESVYAWHSRGYLLEMKKDTGSWENALQSYDRVLSMNPDWIYTLNNKGNLLRSLKQYDSAYCYLKKGLKLAPRHSVLLGNLAVLFQNRGEFDSALAYHRKVITYFPAQFRGFINIGDCFYDLKMLDSSLFYLRRALQLAPRDENILNRIGYTFRSMGEYDSAKLYLQEALVINNRMAEAWVNLANVYSDIKNYDIAFDTYRKSYGIDSKQLMALLGMGNIKFWLKQYDSAAYFYQKLIVQDASFYQAYHGIGNVYYYKKNTDSTLYYYLKALQFNPHEVSLNSGVGRIYLIHAQYDSAQFYIRKALAKDPEDAVSRNSLGLYFRATGKLDSALITIKKALAVAKSELDVMYNNLGETYYLLKQYDSAVSAYESAINYGGTTELRLSRLGNSFQNLNQCDSAVFYYQKASMLNDRNEYLFMNMATCFKALGKTDSAISYYRKTLNINPEKKEVLYDLGILLMNKGEAKAASFLLKRFLLLEPESKVAWVDLGLVYRSRVMYDSAVFCFQNGKKYDPANRKLDGFIGYAFEKLKQYDSAIHYFQKALYLNPGDKDALLMIGTCLTMKGNYPGAIPYLKNAIQLGHQSGNTDFLLGLLYLEIKHTDSAIWFLEKSYKDDINNAERQSALSKAYTSKGDSTYKLKEYSLAINSYLKALEIGKDKMKGKSNLIYNISCCYSLQNDKPNTLRYLEESLNAGFNNFKHIESDKDLEWLWNDPDFQSLLKKFKK